MTRVGDWRQVDKEDTVFEHLQQAGSHVHSKARLASSARPGKRKEPHWRSRRQQMLARTLDFLLTPEQWCGLRRKIVS